VETVDTERLISAGRDIRMPFRMQVPRSGGECVEIEFVKTLRLLPSKRIVALARDQGKPILVKTFLGRYASRNAAREVSGVEAITRAGVRTTDLLWQAELPGNGRMLAFEYLDGATSLFEQWSSSECEADRVDILARVVKIMSQLHNHGVIQQDIHLANFLLCDGEIHTIDGGGILQKERGALPEPVSIGNLALFFAQFLARHDGLIPQAFAKYQRDRQWPVDDSRLNRLLREVTRCREIRKRNYIGKAFRDCTRFVCRSSFRRFVVCERRAYDDEMKDLIAHPDRHMASGTSLKDGNSATVTMVKLEDRVLVIKRYNVKSILHRLRRAFRKSRAWVSWQNAYRLEFLGIPALKPVALIEERVGPLRSRAYFISEYIDGPDALQSLQNLSDPVADPEALATILQELSDSRISHGDLKATNFLMTGHGPVIIDLDGMQEHKNRDSFERAFRSDLQRFMENWKDFPGLTDRFSGLLSDLNQRYGVQ
jgi:tRNA A-37 threonylcarbamoyl transferase component Bud32